MDERSRERIAWRAYHKACALFRDNGAPEADCEDLAHEVVYRLLCCLEQGNPVCDRWIETVAYRVLSDYHRKRMQEREAQAHLAHECASGDEAAWYSLLALREAMARLPDAQRVLLTAYAEKDTDCLRAIATQEGVSLGAVYKRAERLIVHLRRQLRDE
ncbi:MAG: sigma-70 family RNA polymerase sigma factor [Fimbriimonadales bacterium]|nr:MAG: hypothetical protein KatS3mg018_2544 [Fimbriimonadales bacterium]